MISFMWHSRIGETNLWLIEIRTVVTKRGVGNYWGVSIVYPDRGVGCKGAYTSKLMKLST